MSYAQKKLIDKEKIQSEILAFINLHGATSSQTLRQLFKISQSTLSRAISSVKNELIIIGKARETKYAIQRKITDTITPIPIYEILENATSRQFGTLYALKPNGFYFETKTPDATSGIYNDLPYFLNDIRPTGFLGRFIPMQNEDLHLPKDISLWTAEHSLKYLSQRGWNVIGNFILGDLSFQLYLEKSHSIKNTITTKNRENDYSLYANDVLTTSDPGSSVGGEQPKFTAFLVPENQHVLVKFSPPTHTEIGKRVADILICEHIALQTLKKNACETADSNILIHDSRVFLEIKRFDRIGKCGRRGLISLGTLDAEFSGTMSTWSKTATDLINTKVIPEHLLEKILFREMFGELIANNDMHPYNLSFFTQGNIITDLAPVYDMCPMLFMPRNNQIIKREFTPRLPLPENAKIWITALATAKEFWNSVLADERISIPFKNIAISCQNKLNELNDLTQLLPR
ncbi:MAG: type II toxin-antitoxin system HipA family toxin YjjJ [Gammaproteobacteria bacterium]|nr:type II toxin-antitoxin system HipA family toxin YjjJ [Gammaproteobacteria bacterium]